MRIKEDRGTDYRHENKYMISIEEAHALTGRLMQVMRFDSHSDGQGKYLVTSVYFDTPDNRSLKASVTGCEKRKKYRIRAYNRSDSFIALEKKEKYKSLGRKTSVVISREIYDNILYSDGRLLRGLENPLADEFYYELTTNGFRPVTIVEYTRRTFTHPISNTRITLDMNIKGSGSGFDMFYDAGALVPTISPLAVVLEVKYNHFLPDFIACLLPRRATPRQSVSKYVYGRTYK